MSTNPHRLTTTPSAGTPTTRTFGTSRELSALKMFSAYTDTICDSLKMSSDGAAPSSDGDDSPVKSRTTTLHTAPDGTRTRMPPPELLQSRANTPHAPTPIADADAGDANTPACRSQSRGVPNGSCPVNQQSSYLTLSALVKPESCCGPL